MRSIVERFAGMPEVPKRCAACNRIWHTGHDCGTGSRKRESDND